MMMKSRLIALACTLALAAAVYALCPPPRPASAFEAQSTWGGTAGGSANAVTVAIANVQSLNDILGVPLRFVPALDNTGPATIAVNGLTATAVRRPSNIGLVALSGGELQAGVSTEIMYNGSTIEIRGPLDMTPIGRTVEFRGSVTPRGTLIEDGSCVSRTTFAPLFSVVGTNYGACDGTTTFGLPDSRGAMFAALDGQGANGLAGRITTATCPTPNAVGLCGSQTHILSVGELPSHTHSGATGAMNQNATHSHTSDAIRNLGPGGGAGNWSSGGFEVGHAATINAANIDHTHSFTTDNGTGGGLAHSVLNPISLGRRAIKY